MIIKITDSNSCSLCVWVIHYLIVKIFENFKYISFCSEAIPSLFVIDAGIHNRYTSDSWSQRNLTISKIIVHQGFNWDTIQNDIALIKLSVIILKYYILKNYKIIILFQLSNQLNSILLIIK